MAELRCEWNPAKAAANQRKHGVSFDEASTAFADEHALLRDDPDHSADEDRFVLIGLSAASVRPCVYSWCVTAITRART